MVAIEGMQDGALGSTGVIERSAETVGTRTIVPNGDQSRGIVQTRDRVPGSWGNWKNGRGY